MSTQKMSLDELAEILTQNGYVVWSPPVPVRPETVEEQPQEMKTVVITFKGGWGGGGFLYNGMYSSDFKKKHGINPTPISGQVLTVTMMHPSESFQAEVIKEIEREGSDFDHGHTSDWKSNDFLLKDPNLPHSPLVVNQVSLMYLLNHDYEVSYDL